MSKQYKPRIYPKLIEEEKLREKLTATEQVLYHVLLNYSINHLDNIYKYQGDKRDVIIKSITRFEVNIQGEIKHCDYIPCREPEHQKEWLGLSYEMLRRARKALKDKEIIKCDKKENEYILVYPTLLNKGEHNMCYCEYIVPACTHNPKKVLLLLWLKNRYDYFLKQGKQLKMSYNYIGNKVLIPESTVKNYIQFFKKAGLIKMQQVKSTPIYYDVTVVPETPQPESDAKGYVDEEDEYMQVKQEEKRKRQLEIEQQEQARKDKQVISLDGNVFDTFWSAFEHDDAYAYAEGNSDERQQYVDKLAPVNGYTVKIDNDWFKPEDAGRCDRYLYGFKHVKDAVT